MLACLLGVLLAKPFLSSVGQGQRSVVRGRNGATIATNTTTNQSTFNQR